MLATHWRSAARQLSSSPKRRSCGNVLWNVDTKTLVCVFVVRERTRVCAVKIKTRAPSWSNLRCSFATKGTNNTHHPGTGVRRGN